MTSFLYKVSHDVSTYLEDCGNENATYELNAFLGWLSRKCAEKPERWGDKED